MTNEEYQYEFQLLKNNLVDSYVIYHERVTLLLQLTLFEIQETRVNFKAKIIKPLDKIRAEENNLYQHMISKEEISFSACKPLYAIFNSQLIAIDQTNLKIFVSL
ncbi:MAG: hypothetical protein IPG85_12040 [Bacteroidetes bacterium]|nr:hypothetical protein [Bacteroidota bacterium]